MRKYIGFFVIFMSFSFSASYGAVVAYDESPRNNIYNHNGQTTPRNNIYNNPNVKPQYDDGNWNDGSNNYYNGNNTIIYDNNPNPVIINPIEEPIIITPENNNNYDNSDY